MESVSSHTIARSFIDSTLVSSHGYRRHIVTIICFGNESLTLPRNFVNIKMHVVRSLTNQQSLLNHLVAIGNRRSNSFKSSARWNLREREGSKKFVSNMTFFV